VLRNIQASRSKNAMEPLVKKVILKRSGIKTIGSGPAVVYIWPARSKILSYKLENPALSRFAALNCKPSGYN
jgi:hypothetical protein